MADKQQLQQEYDALVANLKANVNTLSASEKRQGLQRARALQQQIAAATAAEVEAQERAALATRPLTLTGRPPTSPPVEREGFPTPEQFAQEQLGMAEREQLKGVALAGGIARRWEGVKQAAQAANIALRKWLGKPTTEQQMELAEAREAYDKERRAYRTAMVTDAKALGMSSAPLRIAEEIGAIIPEAAILGGGAAMMRTSLSRIPVEAGLAALGGATEPAMSDDEMKQNMLVAGGLGAGIATGVWATFWAPNSALRTLESGRGGVIESLFSPREAGLASEFAVRNEELAKRFNPDLNLTPAMLTQNETIAQMERAVVGNPGTAKMDTLVDIENKIFQSFKEISDKLNPDNLEFPTIIEATRGAMRRHRDQLAAVRRSQWQSTMDEAVELTGGKPVTKGTFRTYEGGKPIIDADTFRDTMIGLLQDAQSRRLLNAEQEAAVKKFVDRWAGTLKQGGDKLTAADTQRLLVELSDELDSKGAAFSVLGAQQSKRWASTLKDAVLQDLDKTAGKLDAIEQRAAQQGGKPRIRPDELDAPQAAQVAKLLRSAREQYATASEAIETFEAKALWNMLNNLDQTNEGWYNRVMSLEPSEMKEFLALADEAQPGMANAVRGRVIMDAFERNRTVQSLGQQSEQAQQLNFDMDGVLEDLLHKGKGSVSRYEALFPAGTHDPQTLQKARDGLEILQLVTAPRTNTQAASHMAKFREAAINVISQSPEFFGRWVLGELQPMTLEKMIFSREGVQALAKVGEFKGQRAMLLAGKAGQGVGVQTFTQALAQFVANADSIMWEEEQARKAQEREQGRQAAVRQGDPRAMAGRGL